jgi:hypothetical protein
MGSINWKSKKVLVGAGLVLIGGGAAGIWYGAKPEPPKRVWSKMHGHWHDVPEPRPGMVWDAESGSFRTVGGQPMNAPPGQVWSEEHKHFHAPNEGH